jgi:hypothetical protein
MQKKEKITTTTTERIMILSQITKYCLPPKGCHMLPMSSSEGRESSKV